MKIFFISLIVFFFVVSFSTQAQVSEAEYKALVAIHKFIAKDVKKNWDITQDPKNNTVNSTWWGITVDSIKNSTVKTPQQAKFRIVELHFSRNELKTVPVEVAELIYLRKLSFAHNWIDDLPEELANLPNLEELILDDNYGLKHFPSVIFKLKNLKVLEFKDSWLTKIPKEIEELKMLRHLDLSNNKLKKIPKNISKL
jgi:Leucine-rich repeat (LRR) protein